MTSDSKNKTLHIALWKLRRLVSCKRNVCTLAVLLFLVFISWWQYYLSFYAEPPMHVSSPDQQPLVIIKHNFMSEAEFFELQFHLPHHPLIRKNNLNEENFNFTRGWLTKFNLEGIKSFERNADFQVVLPFFERVRMPESNAFVMNLLIADESPGNNDAVGVHLDDTVGIDHPHSFLAHQVDVLYVEIPDGFQGGELEAWPFENEEAESNKAIITPATNTLVEFKGTAFHRVRSFKSNGEPRISLVLEQYRIEELYYPYTVTFCLNEDCE